MYNGVYEGNNDKVKLLNKKILILGESHYSKDENCDFTTDSVIKNYHDNPKESKYHFFHKIAQSFNIDTNDIDTEFSEFWDYIYFGNYIHDLCGINDKRAKNFLGKKAYRKECNNKLFDFINNNNIEIVFVFSRLTYNNLPGFSKKHKKDENLENADNGNLTVGKSKEYRDWISHCKYLANIEHPNVDVILNKDIEVYGMRHPSARGGYRIENYCNILGELFEDFKK